MRKHNESFIKDMLLKLEGFTHLLEVFTHLLENFIHVLEGFTHN